MKLSDLKNGDTVVADEGFPCLEAGVHEVKADPYGALYIDCSVGRHYLDGQAAEDEELIGLKKGE